MSNPSLTTKFIEIQGVEQTFKTKKGPFQALRDINPVSYTHLDVYKRQDPAKYADSFKVRA